MSDRRRGVAVLVWYYAPPALGIAAQRLLGFVRHLPAFGWDPVVVAPADPHFHRSQSGLRLPDGVAVHRTGSHEPSRWLRRLAGHRSSEPEGGVRTVDPAPVGSAGRLLRRLARDWLYVPDAQLLWVPAAAAATERAVREARSTRVVVLSSSVPYSAHFAARRAAGRAGVPWVAEYRDPWTAAPPQFGHRPALRRAVDRRMDTDLVRAADAVVVTSETTAELFARCFQAVGPRRLRVVRNGFEPSPEAPLPAPADPLRIVYSGTLLSAAYAEPVLDALGRIWARAPGTVHLDVYGPAAPWLAARAGEAPPFLRLHGMVPAEEMPAHLASASALLLLQPDPGHVPHIAGKLYEYLGSRRPVLASLPAGCEAETLVERFGDARGIRPLTVEAAEAALETLLRDHRGGRLQGPTVPAARVEPLTRREQARRLGELLDELTR